MAGNPERLYLDPAANQAARKYARSEQAMRMAWSFGRWLVRLSPRPMFAWRRAVLRLFGAKIGAHVRVYSSTDLYMPWNVEIGDWAALGEDVFLYSLGRITIGANASLAYRTHVCAGSHDFEDPTLPLLKPEVRIGEGVWIGTEAFIGPGVTLGSGALIGARAVVVKDIPSMQIVAGNPARIVGTRKRT